MISRRAPDSFVRRVKEIDMFFQGSDPVHQTMRRVATEFDRANIAYVIVGGMAVNAHRHSRTTRDVDFLVSASGIAAFRQLAKTAGFEPVAGRSRRFVDRTTGIHFDFLVTGLFPGSGAPGPIAYPDPATVAQNIDDLQIVDLPTLVQLKLAARRHQDFADVVNLIRANELDETFGQQLHPSVQADYVACLEEKRREDEYEKRQDQAFDQSTGDKGESGADEG